jgi:hypothetical protein
MSPRRLTLLLLGALFALLGLPASALAAVPDNTTPAPPAGGWVQSGYTVTPTGTDTDGDPIDLVEWDLNDGNGPQTGPPGSSVAIPPAPPVVQLTTRVRANGEWSAPRTDTYNVDDIAPDDNTTTNATWYSGPVDVPLVGDAAGGSPITKFQWRLDGNPVPTDTAGLGPWTVSVVADGPHTLYTRVFDMAGNVSAWEPHTVNVDAVTPTDTTAVSGAWSTTSPVVVAVTGSDAHSGIAQVRWRLGTTGAFTTVNGTTTNVNVSGDGIRTLQTQVVDAAGHTSTVTSHTVRLDTTAPANQTDAPPAGWRDGAWNVTVRGADDGSGISHVEWSVDGGPFTQGSPTAAATVSGHGSHTLTTRVWDVAGNSTERDDTIQIDMVDPANTTAVPPGTPQNNPYTLPVTGTDSGSGVQKVEWKIDGGATQSGPSGATATVTGHGVHTIETRVVDNVGRTSGWRSNTVTIDAVTNDTVDPVDTTTTAPAGWHPAAIDVTVSATDDGSGVTQLRWRINGQQYIWPGTSPSFTLATEGKHVLETRAFDAKGNATDWRVQTFKIDFSVPADTTAVADGAWRDSRTFTLSGTDAVSGIQGIEYSVNGAPTQVGTNGQNVTMPSDGAYTVTTRAIDRADNASPQRTVTMKVDTVDPVNTTPVPDSDWTNAPLELVPAGTDAASGVDRIEWRVDRGAIRTETPIAIGEDGEHVLETRVVDEAGNDSGWRADPVKIDTAAPVNTTPAAPAGWRAMPYSVVIAGDDGAGSGLGVIERTIDGGAVSNDPTVTITGDGVHTLRSRVVDAVGHDSEWREDVIRIDSAAPTAGLSCSAGADVWSAVPVSCTVAADGGPSGLGSLTLAGADGGTASVASGAVATVSADGRHVLRLDAVDGAANSAAAEAVVHVDRTAPEASLSCTAAGGKHTCTATASDATSGLAAVGYSVDGGSLRTIAAGATFTVSKGKVQLRAADAAGNVNVTAPLTLAAIPEGATVRITSVPVYLKGRKKTENMLGALNAVRSENGTVSLDLRPLAVGRGHYRVEISLKSGKRSRKVKREYKVGSTGTLPRMSASLSRAVEKTTVKLTVRKRVGGRWRSHASTKLVLPK